MSDNYKPEEGDVVTLKSGGPAMTVAILFGPSRIECVWFQDGKYETHNFPEWALRKVVQK